MKSQRGPPSGCGPKEFLWVQWYLFVSSFHRHNVEWKSSEYPHKKILLIRTITTCFLLLKRDWTPCPILDPYGPETKVRVGSLVTSSNESIAKLHHHWRSNWAERYFPFEWMIFESPSALHLLSWSKYFSPLSKNIRIFADAIKNSCWVSLKGWDG